MGDYLAAYFAGCLVRVLLVVLVLLAIAFAVGYWFARHSVKVQSPIIVQPAAVAAKENI
jgi:hypothetical protein